MTDTTQATETTTDAGSPSGAGAGSADPTTGQSPTEAGKGAATGGASEAGTGGAAAKGGKGKPEGAAASGADADAPFWEGLPDDLKKEKSVTRWKTVEEMARAAVAAERRLGVPADQLVRLPSNDEERKALYQKLGAPETPEGYKIELPKEATDADRALLDRFNKAMHENGPFPPDFAKAAVDFINGETLAAMEAEAAAAEEARAAGEALLKKELGAAYDPDMKAVGKMLNDLGGEDLMKELDRTGLGNSPQLMLALHKLMAERGEPQALEGGNRGTSPAGAVSPGQARAALANLESDPIKGPALRDKAHPMHAQVLAERTRLARMADGIDPDA